MLSKLLLLVALALVDVSVSVSLPKNIEGIRRVLSSFHTKDYEPEECSNNLIGKIVCNNCTSYRVCFGGELTSELKKCPIDLPHCTKYPYGSFCSATPDPEEKDCETEISEQIDCTSTGVFPDAENCNIFHKCEEFPGKSTVKNCPPGYRFNPVKSWSELKPCAVNQNCSKVNCDVTTLFAPYGTDKSNYYAYCESGVPKMILQCDYEYFMNFQSNTCEYYRKCQHEGYTYADKKNTIFYYECYLNENDELVAVMRKCPDGKHFSDVTDTCE